MSRQAKAKALSVQGGKRARQGLRTSGQKLLDEVLATAPKLPVRNQAALLAQYPGLTPDEIADSLIRTASRATAATGATVGAWAVLPFVPAFPVEIAAETLAVVGIEVKLVAELHELYGLGVPGAGASRMTAYVIAWGERRSAVLVPGSLALAIGSPLRKRLSRRLAHRAGRNTLSLGPLLTGAAAGALFNRRETRRIGQEVLDDIRKNRSALEGTL
ncbi:conserved hypothetical protein [Catenulispora acidiphila DSM 44928]|jgi:hypothetical protein|uniref:Uncharacterized protein n=1 Tax=Catenulispora acidiphila (strain DSM 44928 / JCM 14897 / NBRC 102108 / NRRL B-24433 / ID139908) TaxID=479433 RepID=C7Q973_CATAD|nr:hypothetical protein [Catenulispora acidiphila]ACU72393.1 conserved hypothetical protein [Catenulispora acidiphila DSM 44928]